MPNYTIYSCNPKDTEHSAETRLGSIKDVKIGDYLTEQHATDGQMFTLELYVITKISDTSVTIEQFIHDGRGLYKSIRLSWIPRTATWGYGHLSNKSHRCYFSHFIKSEELDTTDLKVMY